MGAACPMFQSPDCDSPDPWSQDDWADSRVEASDCERRDAVCADDWVDWLKSTPIPLSPVAGDSAERESAEEEEVAIDCEMCVPADVYEHMMLAREKVATRGVHELIYVRT